MFNVRLRELRERRGFNQSEFAELMNVARTTYSGYENGLREPDFDFVIKMADYYNVSLDYLFGRDYKSSEFTTLVEKLPAHKADAIKTLIKLIVEK